MAIKQKWRRKIVENNVYRMTGTEQKGIRIHRLKFDKLAPLLTALL